MSRLNPRTGGAVRHGNSARTGPPTADENATLAQAKQWVVATYESEKMIMAFELKGVSPLLSVYDMPTAVHFYRDLLGFEVLNHSPLLSAAPDDFHWAMLQRDHAEIMLNTAYDEGERPAAPDPRRIVVHGETMLYFGCPDVDAAYRDLHAAGVHVQEPVVAHYGMKQLSFSDPDGYGLCFQWPV